MAGSKARRRASKTPDVIRIDGDLPLIVDTTELITPEVAQKMLHRNPSNRPINWRKVEEYSAIMKRGEWVLHAQGLVLDGDGNLLTGQKRLWAVIYSDVSVYMRVSRGNPKKTARLLDRGTPQSARDLASRDTDKKHSPTESSIARAIWALRGTLRPSTDQLAQVIAANSANASVLLNETKGTKKTRVMLMVFAAISEVSGGPDETKLLARRIGSLCDRLDMMLLPMLAQKCWGRGAAFGLAMGHALTCVEDAKKTGD